jgi:hypothetical protein
MEVLARWMEIITLNSISVTGLIISRGVWSQFMGLHRKNLRLFSFVRWSTWKRIIHI